MNDGTIGALRQKCTTEFSGIEADSHVQSHAARETPGGIVIEFDRAPIG